VEEKFQLVGILLAMVVIAVVLQFSVRFAQESLNAEEWVEFEPYRISVETDNPEMDGRLNFFSSVTGIVRDTFPYLNIKESRFDYSWQDITTYYQSLIEDETLSEQAYLFSISEMLSLLDDPGSRLTDRNLSGIEHNLLINIKTKGEQVILKNYHEAFRDNEEYMEYLEPEDILLKVDDRNAWDLYRVMREDSVYGLYPETVGMFGERYFMTYYHQYLEEINPQYCKLDFLKADGTEYTLLLEWQEAMNITGVNGVVITGVNNGTTYGEYIEDSNLAYIRLNSFYMANLPLFQSEMARMQNTSGMILDLRGADKAIDYITFEKAILGYFTETQEILFYEKIKYSPLLLRFSEHEYEPIENEYYPVEKITILPASSYYKEPLVVLVDENFMESPDELIMGLMTLADTTIIGRGYEVHALGNSISVDTPYLNYGFRLSTAYLYDTKMKKMENELLIMDLEIPYSSEEADGTLDPVLRAGIEWFEEE
jgi:hypothetical protein